MNFLIIYQSYEPRKIAINLNKNLHKFFYLKYVKYQVQIYQEGADYISKPSGPD